MLTNIISISLGAILINNFIFSQFLGCCPFLGCSNKVDTAVGMGLAVTFVMGLASAICWVIDQLRAKGKKIFTRMDTNGTASLIHGRDTAPDFAGRFDMVSISLNTDTAEKYNALCHPIYPDAYEAMKAFAKEVRRYVPQVMMTVVDTIPREEIESCRRICEEEIGATYRVREYISG